jgi:kumamolisin
MVASMVAPQLSRFDLWVHPISESDDDGDVEGFLALLAQPLQATTNGTPLPHVISVSYGVCESTVKPYTASRTLVERELTAEAALGITVVVAAGDTGSSACARGVPANQLTSSDKKPQLSWPASSPWVLAVGGTNLTLNGANGIDSTGVWNDTEYPAPFNSTAGGGGGSSAFVSRPWWQPAQPFGASGKRMVPDVAAFADESPGYPVVCSKGVQSCPGGAGQSIAFVGGTSAATPLVAGMIALWNQQAQQQGLPRPGFVPPLLYRLAQTQPTAFADITLGTNALFGGSCCPARPGFDTASGWGSPFADAVASALATVR